MHDKAIHEEKCWANFEKPICFRFNSPHKSVGMSFFVNSSGEISINHSEYINKVWYSAEGFTLPQFRQQRGYWAYRDICASLKFSSQHSILKNDNSTKIRTRLLECVDGGYGCIVSSVKRWLIPRDEYLTLVWLSLVIIDFLRLFIAYEWFFRVHHMVVWLVGDGATILSLVYPRAAWLLFRSDDAEIIILWWRW